MASPFRRVLERIDDYQRTRAWLGFPFAVAKKFGDDKAGHLAALVAYYAFFSLFPLLMVFTAVLGMVLRGNPELQDAIVDSALTQFPVIGDQIRENLGQIKGSGVALGVGVATALWAGTGVTNALQSALNSVWDVPIKRQPNFLIARLRSLAMLAILGVLTVAAALLSGLGASSEGIGVLRIVGILGGIAVNLALFLLAFRILPNKKLSWRDVFRGAAVAAIGWWLLQMVGTWYVDRQLRGATQIYGTFAFVIGLLVWLYLGSQLMLYAAQVNAVRVNRLWPRGLLPGSLTEADRRALRRMARVEERREDERVDVEFTSGGDPDGPKSSGESPDGLPEGRDDAPADPRAAADRARAALEEANQALAEAKRAIGEDRSGA